MHVRLLACQGPPTSGSSFFAHEPYACACTLHTDRAFDSLGSILSVPGREMLPADMLCEAALIISDEKVDTSSHRP